MIELGQFSSKKHKDNLHYKKEIVCNEMIRVIVMMYSEHNLARQLNDIFYIVITISNKTYVESNVDVNSSVMKTSNRA